MSMAGLSRPDLRTQVSRVAGWPIETRFTHSGIACRALAGLSRPDLCILVSCIAGWPVKTRFTLTNIACLWLAYRDQIYALRYRVSLADLSRPDLRIRVSCIAGWPVKTIFTLTNIACLWLAYRDQIYGLRYHVSLAGLPRPGLRTQGDWHMLCTNFDTFCAQWTAAGRCGASGHGARWCVGSGGGRVTARAQTPSRPLGAGLATGLALTSLTASLDPAKVRRLFALLGWVCKTTSKTDPSPRLHLLGANWRPWHLKLKLSLSVSQQVVCTLRQGFTCWVPTGDHGA